MLKIASLYYGVDKSGVVTFRVALLNEYMLKTWTTELWMIRTVSAFILSTHVFLLSFSSVPIFPSLLKASFSFREQYLFRPCLYSYHHPPLSVFIKMDRKMELK